jgi:predicted lipoprotein with Yx(FWY)xxD motif
MNHLRIPLSNGAVALFSFFALGAGASTATAAQKPGAQAGISIHLTSSKTLTLHTETAVVGSKAEKVLVNAAGLPLYYFRSDTPTTSRVNGGLARLWPPLIAARPMASGVKGKVLSLKQAAGPQVSYKGHFLYTFIDDSPGHVTGQGVSNFFVATPNISASGNTTTVPVPTSPASHRYGY